LFDGIFCYNTTMNKVNYQLEMDKVIKELQSQKRTPTLLLHCCCAPCATHCLTTLSPYFKLTTYFFNPNIFPDTEYEQRKNELERLVKSIDSVNKIKQLTAEYNPQDFFELAKGVENAPEGGERCVKCFYARLKSTAQKAREGGYEYITTTLTISPLKNAQLINEIGEQVAKEEGVKWLPTDFKKQNGYLNSIKLSEQYELYRQNYCGCVFSQQNQK